MTDVAIKIVLTEELIAISEGQCGFCRIGVTHKHNKCCDKVEYQKYYQPMIHCQCGSMYDVRFDQCPICEKGEKYNEEGYII